MLGTEGDPVSDPVPLALPLPLLVSALPLADDPLELPAPAGAGFSLDEDGEVPVGLSLDEELELEAGVSLDDGVPEVLPLPELESLELGLAALGSVLLSVFAPSSRRHCSFAAPLIESQCAEPPAP